MRELKKTAGVPVALETGIVVYLQGFILFSLYFFRKNVSTLGIFVVYLCVFLLYSTRARFYRGFVTLPVFP